MFVVRNLFLSVVCAFVFAFPFAVNAESPQHSIESETEIQEFFVDISWKTTDDSSGMHFLVKCINGTSAEVSEGICIDGDSSDLVKVSVTPLLAHDRKNISMYCVLSLKDAVIFDGICHTENENAVSIGNKDIIFSLIPSLTPNRSCRGQQ